MKDDHFNLIVLILFLFVFCFCVKSCQNYLAKGEEGQTERNCDSIIAIKDKQVDSLRNVIDIQEKYFDLMVKPNMQPFVDTDDLTGNLTK